MTTLTSGTTGTDGADKIVLGGGDDVIDGGLGSDTINAGAGNDTLIYTFANEKNVCDYYNGGSGKDTLVLDFSKYAGWTYDSWNAFEAKLALRIAEFTAMVDKYKAANGTLSNSAATNFTFAFTDDLKLQVAMIEKVVVIAPVVVPSNHAPVITSPAQVGEVQEDLVLSDTGQVMATDADNGAVLSFSVAASSGNPGYGSLAIDSDTGAWTYTLDNGVDGFDSPVQSLAEGQVAHETFTVTVTDDQGATATQDVVVTLTGTNDAPEINLVEFNGTRRENGTRLLDFLITARDIDQGDTLTLSVDGASEYGTYTVSTDGHVIFSQAYNDATRALAQGEMVVESFTASYTDNYSASVGYTGYFSLQGFNDAPVITSSAQAGSVREDSVLSASGDVTAWDIDHGASWTFSGSATGQYGNFTVAPNGHWTYALDNGAAIVQSLAQGETKEETFVVTVTDDKEATATQSVTISIAGSNDAPSGLTFTPTIWTSGNTLPGQGVVIGSFSAIDVDAGAALTYSVGGDSHFSLPDGHLVTSAALEEGSLYDLTVTVSDSMAATNIRVIVQTGTTAPDDIDLEMMTGEVEAETTVIYGLGNPAGVAPEILWGTRGSDVIFGQDGSDILVGVIGDDTLYGGSGNDAIAGDPGNDKLYGGPNDDSLHGEEGNDALFGDDGNDSLYGGKGSDVLSGGAGADQFYLDTFFAGVLATSGDADQIQDFQKGEDKIRIARQGIAPSSPSPSHDLSPYFATWTEGDPPLASGIRIVATTATDGHVNVYYDPTGGTQDDAVLIGMVNVAGGGTLDASDFYLI